MPVLELIAGFAGFILILGAVLVLFKQDMDFRTVVPMLLVIMVLGAIVPSAIVAVDYSEWVEPEEPIEWEMLGACVDIEEPGHYKLMGDMSPVFQELVCFSIESNDVVLDCDGFVISGVFGDEDGVWISGSDNVTVRNCEFTNLGYGISTFSSNGLDFNNNQFYEFGPGGNAHIRVASSLFEGFSDVSITESVFDLSHRIAGVSLYCGEMGVCESITVSWNEFACDPIAEDCEDAIGVVAEGTEPLEGNFNNFDLEYNSFSILDEGISLSSLGENVSVSHSSFDDVFQALYLRRSTYGVVFNNSFEGGFTGIWLWGGSSNIVLNNTLLDVSDIGIAFYGEYSPTVQYNDLDGSEFGLFFAGTGQGYIFGNTVVWSENGVHLVAGNGWDPNSNLEFEDNAVSNSGGFDFYCGDVVEHMDSGNTCSSNNALCGAWLYSCSGP